MKKSNASSDWRKSPSSKGFALHAQPAWSPFRRCRPVSVICSHVKGVGLSLDPSQYIYGTERPGNIDKLLPYVQNVYLRDSTPKDIQVRVGQGVIDFGKLITQLQQHRYQRALVVEIVPLPDVDHMGEMRKMRLLLESLLV